MIKNCSYIIKFLAFIFLVCGCLLAIGEISDGEYLKAIKAGGFAAIASVLTYGFSIVVEAATLYLKEKNR